MVLFAAGLGRNVNVTGLCQGGRVTLDFTAIDFETANGHASSACAVGLVRVRDGAVVDRDSWLIRPPTDHNEFLGFNVRIHGITPDMVADAPEWVEQLPRLREFIGTDIAVAHNAGFDMGVIRQACATTIAPTPKLRYICSVQISRKTFDIPSHRLPLAAEAAGFGDFAHHEALADAEACAAIICGAAREHEVDDITALAKATGVKIQRLRAIPLKLT